MLGIGEMGLVSGGARQEVVAALLAKEAVLDGQHVAYEPGLEPSIVLVEKAALAQPSCTKLYRTLAWP